MHTWTSSTPTKYPNVRKPSKQILSECSRRAANVLHAFLSHHHPHHIFWGLIFLPIHITYKCILFFYLLCKKKIHYNNVQAIDAFHFYNMIFCLCKTNQTYVCKGFNHRSVSHKHDTCCLIDDAWHILSDRRRMSARRHRWRITYSERRFLDEQTKASGDLLCVRDLNKQQVAW